MSCPETCSLAAAITGRRSVRQFQSTPVPGQHLETMLRAAIQAPSAGNRQPWRFVVVRNPGLRRELTRAAYGQAFLTAAPAAIVVVADLPRTAARYGERGTSLYALQDTAAAVQNLLLTAMALGYGTCWVGAFDEQQVAASLGLPPDQRPVAMVAVGVPAAEPSPPARRPLDEVVEYRD